MPHGLWPSWYVCIVVMRITHIFLVHLLVRHRQCIKSDGLTSTTGCVHNRMQHLRPNSELYSATDFLIQAGVLRDIALQ